MNSIGERLREERLRRGFSIEQIAESTKINPSLLEAIEANDLERLPGTFFTRSFVRQYAAALGIDASELEPELDRVAAVEQVQEPWAEPQREAISVPPMDSGGLGRSQGARSLGALVSFVLILAACSGLYILWQRTTQPNSAETPKPEPVAVAKPAASKAVPVSTPQAAPQAAQPEAQQTPAQQTPAAEQPAPAAEAAAPPPAPAQPVTTLSTAPGQPPAITVQIRAIAPVWVRLTADSKYLFSGTLQPNDSRKIEAGQWVQLRTGNAAGVEVIWNGKLVGPLGAEGQVRSVEFTPAGFKILAAPAPKPAAPDDGL